MNVTCPTCETVYRVDPAKVPAGGVRARCAECEGEIPVQAAQEQAAAAPAAAAATPAAAPEVAPQPAAPAATPFGAADPDTRARRLARALISDIVVYHPERRERSLANGTLRQEFREEIQRSWEEYVGQVGSAFARETPHFRDALNEVLAGGQRLF